MPRKLVTILAAIIVVAILIIYLAPENGGWARKGFWMAHLVETPERVYRRSGGTFDDAAQLALQRASTRPNPTPDDHMLAATILTRNVLAQEHRPRVAAGGEFAAHDVEQAHLRQNAFDRAREHYLAALRGIQTHIQAAAPTARQPARGAAPAARAPRAARPQAPPQTAGFIIDAALDFALGGIDVLLGNDPVLAAMTGDLFYVGLPGRTIDYPLAQVARQTRDELVGARVAAASAAPTPAARTDAYVRLAVAHTDDPQNSHDSAVNAYMREMVKRLRAEKDGELPALDAIVRDVKNNGPALSENRPAVLQDALDVIARTRAGERTVAVDVTDEEALRLVWARAEHPQNKEASDKIRQAAFDALADCWEEGIAGRKIVCVSGRVSRILSALVLLDHDKRNWEVKTFEQLKNNLFERTKQICKQMATDAAASADPKMQAIGRSYLVTDFEEYKKIGPLDEASARAFIEAVRAEAGRMVDEEIAAANEKTGGVIAPPAAEGMKKEALAALV